MKTIVLQSVPHTEQRYPTVGDYEETAHAISIVVSEMGNERYEWLVAVHELIEKVLCKARGIADADIDAFDMAFEATRPEGDDSEPGYDPKAPYHREHVFAEQVERMLAAELGVDWEAYDRTVSEL